MVFSVPENVKKVWERSNLRGLIIVSLSLQVFLILFASSRKRRGGWIVMFIWSAYLLADWVAAVAIGLISSGQGNISGSPQNNDILAFWAPFLLLHLGGPDTITSFALEDNELWVRHLLALMLQVVSTLYVFLQSLPDNKLWLPTTFVFVSGIIKYAERTRALYLASLDHFGDSACRKPNAGPEYQRIQKLYASIKRANLRAQVLTIRGAEQFENMDYLEDQEVSDMDPRTTLRFAFDFFDIFKGLIVGLLISPQDRHVSREIFLNRSSNDVLHIVEIELSLLYEVLHTKVLVVRNMVGHTFRFANFCCILGALLSFLFLNKHGFRKFDIRLTYGLLIGAIALDFVSFMFMIFSDWTIVTRENWGVECFATSVINRRRWSGSISQYNFMTYCLRDYPDWINKLAESLRLKPILNAIKGMRFCHSKDLRRDREWDFIFGELKEKSREAKTVEIGKRICLHRGDRILGRQENEHLKWTIDEFEYVESVLIWHIATELCFQDGDQEPNPDDDGKNKAICKLISDYMFYLLTIQPTMMSTVSGNWKLIFRDTCAETKRFLRKSTIRNHIEDACKEIREVEAAIKPRALKGGISKSVLFDARILAGRLKKPGEGYRWKLMSQVWVEFLCYAAINCRAYVHAQQPSNGGELLTLVWLLMYHLGLGTEFGVDPVRLQFVVGM